MRALSIVVTLLASAVLSGCPRSHATSQGEAPASDAAAPPLALRVDAAPPEAKGPPKDLNVVLISVDSLRADMPWAGYPRPIAPRLTALEARAVSYTHAYALSSYTSMSVGGLLGGRLPGEMRRDGFFFGFYPKENVMFPELLQAVGVRTMAAHAHGYFKDAGFNRGFDQYELVPNLKWNPNTDENVTSPALEGIAERQLGDPANEHARFFAWYHFLDPHDQYLPHEGIPFGKTPREHYDAEVSFTDEAIGKLLDFIASRSWGARTAIIVTADHGEGFGEHQRWAHGFELFENLVRVPLFFVIPGALPRRIETPRSAIDLAPTILGLFGVPEDTHPPELLDAGTSDAGREAAFEGTSLLGEIYGAPSEPRDVVIDLPMTSDNDRRRALVHGRKKVIAFGADTNFQVFDLDADPDELSPKTRGDAYAELVLRYRAFERTVKDVPPYQCGEGCLNGAYNKKDGGPAEAGAIHSADAGDASP